MPIADDALDGAVQKFWETIPPGGGMVTKWFLVAEGIDNNGRRSLDFVWTEDMKTWEVKGMLGSALDSQLSGELADEILGGDEDA